MSKENRENLLPVCSKYFSTNSGMDESLTDFQEPKKFAAPKTAPKKPDKPKKAPKKIQGQRDIRKVIKSKKNELESYSKDFDHVCKQAGLDVDSEQLQLAIALSKSLQQPTTTGESSETVQTLSTQDRVGKIRTTLLEYGFKVPEIKKTISKRLKRRKKYKLLLTSHEAKNQIICDKYSQVLFGNITLSRNSQNVDDDDITQTQLYHLTTNATYNVLKSIDTFYVDGLLEKSISSGNLLRDWSEIRGRPVSPKLCDPVIMNFSEIECSQDELDIVLSGSLKSCKNVIKSKVEEQKVSLHKFSERKELASANNLDNSVIVLIDDEFETLKSLTTEVTEQRDNLIVPNRDNTLTTVDCKMVDLEPVAMVVHYRSCSPDLFDDEPSIDEERETSQHKVLTTVSSSYCKVDLTKTDQEKAKHPKVQLSQDTNITKRCNEFMEITECIESGLIKNSALKNTTLKLSQNVTKRKSNDFMEITNCIVNPAPLLTIEGDIDLTISPENKKELAKLDGTKTVKDKCNETYNQNVNVDQTKENAILKNINKNSKEISMIENDNIDRTESLDLERTNVENKADKSIESLDLTQSSNTSDELPYISLKISNKVQTADDTIILDPKEYESISKSLVPDDNDEVLDLTETVMHKNINHSSHNNGNDFDSRTRNNETDVSIQKPNDILDLTQEIVITSRRNSKTSDTNLSFFEDYVHNHSDNNDLQNETTPSENNSKDLSPKELCPDIVDTGSKSIENPATVSTPSQNTTSTATHTESNDIDLTQSSESSEELSQNVQNKDYSKSKDRVTESEADSEATVEMEIDKVTQSDIDLTQHSDSEEHNIEYLQNNGSMQSQSINIETEADGDATIEMVKSSQRFSSLSKKDDVSIDYDELNDSLINQHSHSQTSRTSFKSASDDNTGKVSNKSKDTSNCSQNSEVFIISDNELDYSMHQSKLEKPVDNFLFGGISIMDELPSVGSFRRSTNTENNSAAPNNVFSTRNYLEAGVNQTELEPVRTPVKHKRVSQLATPQKPSCSGINTVVTPGNSKYAIETIDVTPMPKYEFMSTEELHNELDKFGVKPFKRKRAIKLLTHIYKQTHPAVESCSDEESPCKRRKTDDYVSPKQSPRKITPRKILSPKKTLKSPRKVSSPKKSKEITKKKVDTEQSNKLNDAEVIQINKNYDVDETPVIKEIVCSPDDWVFQKREKAKVHSCRVPLHIAFHNYVYSRRGLSEAILCYEPINIDDVHKDLVAYGHRYDPKDLLKFMDKKGITVKTTDNDGRNHK